MRNYVLVVILCGFSVRSYLSQDSQVYTFYSGQPFEDVVQVSSFQADRIPLQRQYDDSGVQGPYAEGNIQPGPPQRKRTQNEFRTQVPRQAEFDAQSLPNYPQTRNRNDLYTQGSSQALEKVEQELYVLTNLPPQAGNQNKPYSQLPLQNVFEVQSSDKVSQEPYGFSNYQQAPLETRLQPPHPTEYEVRQEIPDPTQNQYINGTANVNGPNVVRVIYVNNGQQDPVSEIIQQIIGPQSERLTSIQGTPSIQNMLPSENGQSVRVQRPSNQFQVSPQQEQGYSIPVSQQSPQGSDVNSRRQDARLPQYQNLVIPSSEYTRRPGQQSERLTSIQKTPATQNTIPSENGQFQALSQQQQGYSTSVSQQTSQGGDSHNRRQGLTQYQNLVVPPSEHTQNQQSERLISIQKTGPIQNILLENGQSLRIQRPSIQFQALPQQGSESNHRRHNQHLPQYQNLVIPSAEYAQQNFGPQYQTPQNSDRDRYNVLQVPNKPQASEEVLRTQNMSNTTDHQDLHQQGDYQQLSAFGNLQNATKLTGHTTVPTKKPFYINRFAADLYITKKPCEICCKDNELRPCTSCCNATALLNPKTLKTVLG